MKITLFKTELNLAFKVTALSNPFSNKLGKFNSLRVWPVGAVSKTITSNFISSMWLNVFIIKYFLKNI